MQVAPRCLRRLGVVPKLPQRRPDRFRTDSAPILARFCTDWCTRSPPFAQGNRRGDVANDTGVAAPQAGQGKSSFSQQLLNIQKREKRREPLLTTVPTLSSQLV
jgi:hypothetical protein